MSNFKAGFSRVDITPPNGLFMQGYYAERRAEGYLDPLFGNVLAVSDGDKTAVVFSLDVIGINQKVGDECRNVIAKTTGLPYEAVFYAFTQMKSLLSFLLSALLILTVVLTSSCGEASTKDDTDSPQAEDTDYQVTEPVSALSTLPRQDYDGYDFRILVTNQDNRHFDFEAPEETGATLNDLVYRRNSRVEEYLNVNLSIVDDTYTNINSAIAKAVAAGESPYSLYVTNSTVHTLASDGNLLALNTLGGLNLDKSWWDQNAISDMSIAGNIYTVTGDINPTGLLTSECVLFNKKLFDADNIDYPYQTAFKGSWTLDEMYKICAGLTRDIDGDGQISADKDLFSFTCWFDNAYAFYYGAGGRLVEKDADDIPKIAWDIEKINNIYEKIYNIFIDTGANYSTDDHESSFKVFNEGRAYFCGITFLKVDMFLRDMQDDFGVLPIPKYDEQQETYLTDVSTASSLVVLPVSITDPEISANVTDALAAAAYDMITPDLYDVIASTKNVRDKESSEMVQLIIRNRVFDIGHMYFLPGYNFAYDLLLKKSKDIASYFAAIENTANSALEEIIEHYKAVQ